MKKTTVQVSPSGDIVIQRVESIDVSYSIYYQGSCESSKISPETYTQILETLSQDPFRLKTIEMLKKNGSNVSVLSFLLVQEDKEKKNSSITNGFDSFFEKMTGQSTNDFVSGLEQLEKKYLDNIKQIEADKSYKDSEEFLKTFQDQFKLQNVERPSTQETIQKTDEKEKVKTTKQTEGEEKPALEVEYFENKNPKTFGFNGIAGMSELKTELSDSFIKPLKFKFQVEGQLKTLQADPKREKQYKTIYDTFEKFKISIPTGLLFYGPPGTGKTFITKKLAQELGAGLIVKSMGDFGSSYIHQTTVNIKNFFEGAKKESEKGPIILFLDEIDSLLSKRTNNIDAQKAEEVSQFLQEFNKLSEAKNLIVIAATNRPDHLDSAILRSGRLDKKIYIGPPDYIARKELFQMYIEKEDRPHDKLDYDELARLTEGYVAADIEAMCDEVSRDAGKNLLELLNKVNSKKGISDKKLSETLDGQKINMDLLKKAIQDTHSSLKTTDMTIYDEWLKNLEK